MSYFTRYRYNFCWPVRTFGFADGEGRWQERTPAMSAGLADHVWSLEEWRFGSGTARDTGRVGLLRCPQGWPIVCGPWRSG